MVAIPMGWTTLHPSHTDPIPKISPHGRSELPGACATTPSTQPPTKNLTQATHQPLPPFQENQLWRPPPLLAYDFQWTKDRASPLQMSLNLSIIFPKHLNCDNHARSNRLSDWLPRNKLPNLLQKHIGGKKNKGWVGQAQVWLAITHEKISITLRQVTNNVPTKHQTRPPRDTPHMPTLQTKPNQPEPKKKTPVINDPTASSPTVTLLWLLLPLNDKVQWNSHDVNGGKPPSSTQSEYFTRSFNW